MVLPAEFSPEAGDNPDPPVRSVHAGAMSRRTPLPSLLPDEFSWKQARELGVPPSGLRAGDLDAPFQGVRIRGVDRDASGAGSGGSREYDPVRERELSLVRALGTRLTAGQLLSHRSAALLWGAPVPHAGRPQLHAAAVSPGTRPRIRGVIGHSIAAERCEVQRLHGLPVSSAACTWAMLADLPLARLVALGDYFVRLHRPGWGRPNAGRPPHTSLDSLERAVSLGWWKGQRNLERALPLIREDSWSPRESFVRFEIVSAGLPEPQLNIDVFEGGSFLGCVDLAYPQHRIAIEYQGEMHSTRYAADIERIERLRAAGWIVIQVTKHLLARPEELVRRIDIALRRRGWTGAADTRD